MTSFSSDSASETTSLKDKPDGIAGQYMAYDTLGP